MQMRMTIKDFASKYPGYITADCHDGFYRITGTQSLKTAEIAESIDDGTVLDVVEGLVGWGYDVFATIDCGTRSLSVMARACST